MTTTAQSEPEWQNHSERMKLDTRWTKHREAHAKAELALARERATTDLEFARRRSALELAVAYQRGSLRNDPDISDVLATAAEFLNFISPERNP